MQLSTLFAQLLFISVIINGKEVFTT